jgi:putative FmdB family regulatory protein
MPIYDYTCTQCNNKFTLRQGFHDDHEASCPKCNEQAERRFSTPAIVFKGSGFYVNDYGGRTNSSVNSEQTDNQSEQEDSPTESPSDQSKKGHKHPHEF